MKVKINRPAMKKVLVRRNVSQNMLASRIGISGGYFSQMMCGTRYPSGRVRQRILAALAPVTFDDLFIIEEGQDGDGTKTA